MYRKYIFSVSTVEGIYWDFEGAGKTEGLWLYMISILHISWSKTAKSTQELIFFSTFWTANFLHF